MLGAGATIPLGGGSGSAGGSSGFSGRDIIWVDLRFPPGVGNNGTDELPYSTANNGLSAVPDGGTLLLAGGDASTEPGVNIGARSLNARGLSGQSGSGGLSAVLPTLTYAITTGTQRLAFQNISVALVHSGTAASLTQCYFEFCPTVTLTAGGDSPPVYWAGDAACTLSGSGGQLYFDGGNLAGYTANTGGITARSGNITGSLTSPTSILILGGCALSAVSLTAPSITLDEASYKAAVTAGVSFSSTVNVLVVTGTPVDIGTANAAGSGPALANFDHVHKLPFSATNASLAAANATINVNNQRITGLAAPTVGSDAVTKTYADAIAVGLKVKTAAVAVATANQATMSGTAQTIDGVALNTVGMRVLLTAQTTATQNGLWVIAAGAWTRPADFATGSGAAQSYVPITGGTLWAGSAYFDTNTAGSDVVDTNNLTWTLFSQAAIVTAGAGLTKTGNTLDVVATDATIVVAADSVGVGVIGNANLADNTIALARLANAGAQNDFLMRKTAGSGAWEDATLAQAQAALGITTSGALKSVRAATTANITLSGTQTVDGVALVAGDRCLVKNQTTGANNGVYCADRETEILTSSGYKSYDQVAVGDTVLTFNLDTQRAQWKPVKAVHVFPERDLEMLSMESPSHSSLTTLNHRWPVLNRHRQLDGLIRERDASGRFVDDLPDGARFARIVESAHLSGEDYLIRAAVSEAPAKAVHSDALVELVAWFYTEGHVRRNAAGKASSCVRIYQSETVNADKVARIQCALESMVGPPSESLKGGGYLTPQWRRSRRPNGMVVFDLNTAAGRLLLAVAPDKVPTYAFIRQLTQDQLRLFVDVSLAADGHVRANGAGSFVQKSGERLESFLLACHLSGTPTTVSKRDDGCYNVNLVRAVGSQPHLAGQRVQYRGTVWCPEVENGTWFARRRNTHYFTGNTVAAGAWARASDAASAGQLFGGLLVPISEGTANGNQVAQLTTDDPITIGSTSLAFTMGRVAALGSVAPQDITDGAAQIGTSQFGTPIDHVHHLGFTALAAVLAVASSSIAVNSQKITGLANGTVSTDAVNLGQVTSAISTALGAPANPADNGKVAYANAGVLAYAAGVTTSAGANLSVTSTASTGTVASTFKVTDAAHTTLTASTERISALFDFGQTRQFATGALTTQRALRVLAPTYSFVGASTITTAATVAISGAPVAGTNATITNSLALWLESGGIGIGTAIARQGAVRLAPSAGTSGLWWRNNADTQDLAGLFSGTDDVLYAGDPTNGAGVNIRTKSSGFMNLYFGATAEYQVSPTAFNFTDNVAKFGSNPSANAAVNVSNNTTVLGGKTSGGNTAVILSWSGANDITVGDNSTNTNDIYLVPNNAVHIYLGASEAYQFNTSCLDFKSHQARFGASPSTNALINASYSASSTAIIASNDSGGTARNIVSFSSLNEAQFGSGLINTQIIAQGNTWIFSTTASFPGVGHNIAAGGFLSFGTASASGLVRAPNNVVVVTAKSATSGDLALLSTDGADELILGATNVATILATVTTGGYFAVNVNTTTKMTVDTTTVDVRTNRLKMDNTGTIPTAPGSGGYQYVEGGALKWVSSTGRITTMGFA
jgi:hypothetical protein